MFLGRRVIAWNYVCDAFTIKPIITAPMSGSLVITGRPRNSNLTFKSLRGIIMRSSQMSEKVY